MIKKNDIEITPCRFLYFIFINNYVFSSHILTPRNFKLRQIMLNVHERPLT